MTLERVEPTTLWLPDHCSTIFTITFSYNYIFFITCKSCPFWFVDSPFCCKCSYDIQQEDICIKPRSIGFRFEKFYLSKSDLCNRVAQNSKLFGGKEPWTFGLLAFCSVTSAIQTYQLGESEENLSQFL